MTRAEALAMLDVKPATLYTYVSRGLIRRVATPGKKRSLYYREDVDRVRMRGDARATGAVLAAGAIRYGEPIVPTSITEVTPGGPRYRSRNAIDLARAGVPFEAVAELLWTGMLLGEQRWALQPASERVLRMANELCRSGGPIAIHDAFLFLTLAAAIDGGTPEQRVAQSASPALVASQLILLLTGCFGYLSDSARYRPPQPGEGVAQAIVASLGLPRTTKMAQAINAALIVGADHELNPATFVARIAASGEGDLHACVASAICTHSGARIARSCDRLDQFFRGPVTLAALVPRGGDFRGTDITTLAFNHPMYPRGDPRADHLLEMIRGLDVPRPAQLRNILACVEAARDKHRQYPRVEAAISILALALSMPVGAAAGIFTLGRMAGWVAHIAEQRLGGFLIRPRAKFVPAA